LLALEMPVVEDRLFGEIGVGIGKSSSPVIAFSPGIPML
jgi:hypothetical protein